MNRAHESIARAGTGPEARQTCDETNSPAELAECAESTRHRLDRTMQHVEARIAPDRLLDDVIGYLKQVFADVKLRSFSLDRVVDKNPVPFAVMGVGLALVGAGFASYSIARMSRESSGGKQPRQDSREAWEAAEEGDLATHGADADVVHPAEVPNAAMRARPEDEATTEEIQRNRKTLR